MKKYPTHQFSPMFWKVIWAISIVTAVAIGFFYFNLNQALLRILHWIDDLGPWIPWVIILVYIVIVPLLLPGLIFTLGAGYLLGTIEGSACVLVGTGIGSAIAFLAARYSLREFMHEKLRKRRLFRHMDKAMSEEGWKIVLLTRMVPFFPFKLSNYFFGITGITFWRFFWASLIGNIPLTIVNTYIGSLAGDLKSINVGLHHRTPAILAVYGTGIVATIGLGIFIMRLANRMLKKKLYT